MSDILLNPLLLNVLLSVVGFAVLIKCADFFVDGASSFAKNLKISTAVIGLTIVAFGTSAPELAISFSSHLTSNTDMLFGNVIGSNIANILVIFALAIIIKPFKVRDDVVKKEMPILLLITLSATILLLDSLFDQANTNAITRADGIMLLLLFTVFFYYLFTILSFNTDSGSLDEKPKYKMLMSVFMIVFGLAGIIIGSNLVVNNLAAFAYGIGISQKIIAVTIISIGTSLPELVTTVVAAKKGENSIAVGNIVGSNIFNICVVLALPIVIFGDAATKAFNIIDASFLILSVLLFWMFAATGREYKRHEGIIFLAVYSVYICYILIQ